MVVCGSCLHHFARWHTGDGVAHDLLREWTPCLHCLVHHAIGLTVGTLSSLTTLCLAEVDDGMLGRLVEVDLNPVEDVGVAHGWFPCRCAYYRVAEHSASVKVATCPIGTLQALLTIGDDTQVKAHSFGWSLD